MSGPYLTLKFCNSATQPTDIGWREVSIYSGLRVDGTAPKMTLDRVKYYNWVDVSTGLKNLFCHAGMVGFAKPCVDRITNCKNAWFSFKFHSNSFKFSSNLQD